MLCNHHLYFQKLLSPPKGILCSWSIISHASSHSSLTFNLWLPQSEFLFWMPQGISPRSVLKKSSLREKESLVASLCNCSWSEWHTLVLLSLWTWLLSPIQEIVSHGPYHCSKSSDGLSMWPILPIKNTLKSLSFGARSCLLPTLWITVGYCLDLFVSVSFSDYLCQRHIECILTQGGVITEYMCESAFERSSQMIITHVNVLEPPKH